MPAPALILVGGAALLFLAFGGKKKTGNGDSENPPGGVTDSPFDQCLDAGVPPAFKAQAIQILQSVTDVRLLDQAAAAAAGGGYPKIAACLKKKADDLRGNSPPPQPLPNEPPPGQPDPSPNHDPVPPVPPVSSSNMPFTVRWGDSPYYLAAYYTGHGGDYKQLEAINSNLGPWMLHPDPKNPTLGWSGYAHWAPGLHILLPASWNPWPKALPIPATSKPSATFPVPGVGA